jgi:uncharacterized membrane protein
LKNWIFYSLLLGLTAYVPNISINNNNIRLIPRITIPDSEEFQAFGTEPFWSVKVSHTGIVYYSFDRGEKQTFPYVIPLSADGRLPDTVRVYKLQNNSNTMLIIRKVDACSDGMSDNLYPYSALFIQRDMVLEGCAEKSS